MTWPVALKSSDRTMEKRVELLLWLVVTDPKAPRTVNIAWIFSTAKPPPEPPQPRCRSAGGISCLTSACSSQGLSQHRGTGRPWGQHPTPGVR